MVSEFNKLQEVAAAYQTSLKKYVSDGIVIYNENALTIMRRILDKHPNGCFDMIFYPMTASLVKMGKWFLSIKGNGINPKD